MIDKKTSKQIVDNITATLFVGASAVAAYAGYEVFEQSDFTYLQAQGGLFGFLQALLTLINLLYWFKKGAKYIVRKDNELADNGQDWIFKAFCEQWALSIIGLLIIFLWGLTGKGLKWAYIECCCSTVCWVMLIMGKGGCLEPFVEDPDRDSDAA